MKKKIFTLLTLLLCVCSGAWADDAIFSYTVAEEHAKDGTGIEATGGTVDLSVNAVENKNSQGYAAKLSADGQYIKCTLSSGTTLESGDIISLTIYQNSTSSPAVNTYGVTVASTMSDTSFDGTVYVSTSSGKNAYTGTFTVGTKLHGKSIFYVRRNSSSSVYCKSITITRAAADTESPTCTTTQATESATVETPLDLTVTPTHYTSLQWYKATASNLSDAEAISGATSATYAFTAAKADAGKTFYFYCIATNPNATGTKTAQSSTITVNVGSYTANTNRNLLQVKFSNGFEGFIKLGTPNTITAYYMEGESEPTVASITPKADSEGTTFSQSGSTLTVTAEDGTSTTDYTISTNAVSPMNYASATFNGAESWLKTGGAFYATDSKKGWTINKNTEENSNKRISEGKNRLYIFVENATKISIYPSTSSSNARNISYTINDGVAVSGSSVKIPAYSNGSEKYEIATGAKAMIGITNLGSGDLSIRKIEVTGLSNATSKVTISTGSGKTLATYIATQDLDFSNNTNITAYVATAASSTTVTLSPKDQVPAGTPIIIKTASAGADENVDIITNAAAIGDNLLKIGDGTTSIGGSGKYDYILSNGLFYHASAGVLPAGKCYLHLDSAPSGAHELSLSFEDETTAISDALRLNDKGEMTNDSYFDLQGRKVANPTRGLYIVNGRKVVIK